MILRIVLTALLGLLPLLALAAEPPKDPILRIETGRHAAKIDRIAVDTAGRYLVTSSEDKTLRVWELPTGNLIRTIRPPVGDGNEGKLYSVALSPDGSTIACGGWTGWDWEGTACIYLFSRASGRLLQRLTGLSSAITHLAFSPDGRYLAASLGGKSGIRLYRTGDWSLAGEDKEYGGNSASVHFSRDGKLVSTCYDGFLRLYGIGSGSMRLLAKEKAPADLRPYSARFSPDGSLLAVGYLNSPRVSVLSGHDLSHAFEPDTTGVVHGDLFGVAWSSDGNTLFAAGQYQKWFNDVWNQAIRRWSAGGRGAYTDTAAAGNSIMDLAPLADGRLAYGSSQPAFGLLDRDGKRTLFAVPTNADFRDNREGFRLSTDGQKVSFGYEVFGKSPATFDLASRSLAYGIGDDLQRHLTSADGLSITDWKSSTTPKLNSSLLQLKQDETSLSLAIAPDASSFILGTGWSLRRFSRSGELLWEIQSPGAAWALNIAGNGSVVVAAYGDGTIRWHRMNDGKELVALFPHSDKKRWVLWTPSGYYDASPGGEELIGWHLNNGNGKAADFFPSSKFRASYYRPDVIAKVLDTLDESEAVRLANSESGRRQSTATVAQLLPPVVSIISPEYGARVGSKTVTLRYTVKSPEDAPATNARVLVDGRPVEQQRGVKLQGRDNEQTITVTIPERDCEVGIIAENRHATSEPATVKLVWTGARKQEEFAIQPKLYVLSVGVSSYRDRDLALKYAAKDAKDFAAALQKQKGLLYREVQTKVLTDAEATRDDVMDGLDWLQKETTSKDVGIIFIAGHGVNDPTGIYYYLPQNADTGKLKRTGVAFSDIKNTLASLAGKAVLFVDTCHSGNVMGGRRGVADINAVVNELSSAENGAVVFASSTGRQYSLEDEKWGNGAFTKALVEGINGKADYTGKGKITVNMLDLYLSERVKELTGGKQTPTTTKPQTIQDFPLAVKR